MTGEPESGGDPWSLDSHWSSIFFHEIMREWRLLLFGPLLVVAGKQTLVFHFCSSFCMREMFGLSQSSHVHTFHHPRRKTSLIWGVILDRQNRKYQHFLSLGSWHSHRGQVLCNGKARLGPGRLKPPAVPASGVMGVSYLGPALKCSVASRYQPRYPLSIFIRNKDAIFISISSLLLCLLNSSELRQGKQMLPTALLKYQELGV